MQPARYAFAPGHGSELSSRANKSNFLLCHSRMAIERVIDAQPHGQPDEAKHPRKSKRPAPAKSQSYPGNDQRSQRSSDTGSTVEDGYRHAAFLTWKPLSDCLARTR